MRTFPRELARFRDIVNDRGGKLRALSYDALQALASAPVEHLDVDSRPATIGIIIQPIAPGGTLRVVVQGSLDHRRLPGKSIALDGFYKHLDGTVTPMPDEEFDEFD